MELSDKIGIGVCTGIMGLCLSAIIGFGSRGIKTDYVGTYKGKPLVVQHEDMRMKFDPYWIMVDGEQKVTSGGFVTDNGKLVELGNSWKGYRITDYKPIELNKE